METTDVRTNSPRAWLLAARPKTLTAAAVPVMAGSALAAADLGADFRILPCVLCFLFAFILQIDANFINDYFDFRHGIDRADRLGPERACAQGWITPRAMLWGIGVTTVLACLAGLPLLLYGGWPLLVVGAVCVVFAFLYTLGLSYRGWGDVLVLVFFGLVPVGFTYYIQAGTWTQAVVVCALACGLVIDTLLMVNNFRDRDQDRVSGKRTVVVRFGARVGSMAYLWLGFLPCLGCLSLVADGYLGAAVLPQFYLIPHLRAWQQMTAIGHGRALNRVLGLTARNIFLFGLLLSAGLLLQCVWRALLS